MLGLYVVFDIFLSNTCQLIVMHTYKTFGSFHWSFFIFMIIKQNPVWKLSLMVSEYYNNISNTAGEMYSCGYLLWIPIFQPNLCYKSVPHVPEGGGDIPLPPHPPTPQAANSVSEPKRRISWRNGANNIFENWMNHLKLPTTSYPLKGPFMRFLFSGFLHVSSSWGPLIILIELLNLFKNDVCISSCTTDVNDNSVNPNPD